MMGLLQTIAEGGCYWRRKEDSPGHSFAVPNRTPFKIAIEGPQSNRFRQGECRDGYFVSDEGVKHLSASEAVNTIRDISSNAFLYTHFRIDGRWVLADKIRESDWSKVDEVEEEALQIAKDIVGSVAAKRKSDADDVRITRAAAKYAMTNEAIMDLARSAVERRKDMASLVLDLDL